MFAVVYFESCLGPVGVGGVEVSFPCTASAVYVSFVTTDAVM